MHDSKITDRNTRTLNAEGRKNNTLRENKSTAPKRRSTASSSIRAYGVATCSTSNRKLQNHNMRKQEGERADSQRANTSNRTRRGSPHQRVEHNHTSPDVMPPNHSMSEEAPLKSSTLPRAPQYASETRRASPIPGNTTQQNSPFRL